MKPVLPHIVTRLLPQRGAADCAVACLAMYLRVDYEEALVAAAQVCPGVLQDGMNGAEIARAAKRLGATGRWVKRFDIDDAIGILNVAYPDRVDQHVVLLIEGVIYDPSHNPVSRWDHAEYFKYYQAVPDGLFQTKEPIE